MIVLVTGGSGSGKSAFAEDAVMKLRKQHEDICYYIATMKIYDEEGQKKVDRHRMMRAAKNFVTIEAPENIGTVIPEGGIGLLECVSNLVANEMFQDEKIVSRQNVVEKVVASIRQAAEKLNHLVIVTNNVFEDGIEYDGTTMEYLYALGEVNAELARLADKAVEVVVGIPIIIKDT